MLPGLYKVCFHNKQLLQNNVLFNSLVENLKNDNVLLYDHEKIIDFLKHGKEIRLSNPNSVFNFLFQYDNNVCLYESKSVSENSSKIFVVWNPCKSSPTKIHQVLEEAEAEAKRICEKEKVGIYILQGIKLFTPEIIVNIKEENI